MTPDEFWRHMDEAGRTFANAFTSFDTTRYVERVAARGVPFALWIEAERMAYGGATFDRARLDAVRGVVESERKQRYENAPYGNVVGFLNAALFPEGHPYRRLGIGSAAQLESITVDDVKRFHATHYTPDSATLVVVGDFDIAACKREIEADFGPIPRGTSTPLPTPAITAPHATSKTITIRADVKTHTDASCTRCAKSVRGRTASRRSWRRGSDRSSSRSAPRSRPTAQQRPRA